MHEYQMWVSDVSIIYEYHIWVSYMSIIYEYHIWVSYMSIIYECIGCVRIWLSYTCHICAKYDLVYDYHMCVTYVLHQNPHIPTLGSYWDRIVKQVYVWSALTGDSSWIIACLHVYEDFSTYMSIFFCTYMRFCTYMIIIYEYSRIWYSHMSQFPDEMLQVFHFDRLGEFCAPAGSCLLLLMLCTYYSECRTNLLCVLLFLCLFFPNYCQR